MQVLIFSPIVVNAVSLGKSGALDLMFEIIGPYSKKSTTLLKYVCSCLLLYLIHILNDIDH